MASKVGNGMKVVGEMTETRANQSNKHSDEERE